MWGPNSLHHIMIIQYHYNYIFMIKFNISCILSFLNNNTCVNNNKILGMHLKEDQTVIIFLLIYFVFCDTFKRLAFK